MKSFPEGRKRAALRFVVLLGLVSLFADMTYEAARSINGPFLALLGASAAAVGVVSGLGELVGYGLRVVSGLVSDRTRSYWAMTIAGYAVNLLAVPAMALAGRWEVAAALIMAERLGKAVRAPARDAMLSHATQATGRGLGFGLHEAMDQVGAMAGPLIVTAVLACKGGYRTGYAVLLAPALLALAVLAVARFVFPRPEEMEKAPEPGPEGPSGLSQSNRPLPAAFWLYLAAAGCIAVGFFDYPLAAFHMKTRAMVSDASIPLIYAGAMGLDALSALVFGHLYDKKGLGSVVVVVALTAWAAPLVFLSGRNSLLAGMALWGIGMGAQESVIRAVVAGFVPKERRATGYGVFNSGFGLSWFAGSAVMGVLYGRSLPALCVFSVAAQLLSLPLLIAVMKKVKARGPVTAGH